MLALLQMVDKTQHNNEEWYLSNKKKKKFGPSCGSNFFLNIPITETSILSSNMIDSVNLTFLYLQ